MRLIEKCVLFSAVLSYFAADGLYSDHVSCEPTFCGCIFPDGYGIDMKLLKNKNFTINVTDSNIEYHYKICSDVSIEGFPNCSAASLYILKYNGTNITDCQNLGSARDLAFFWQRKQDLPYLGFSKDGVSSKIELICDPNLNKFSLKEFVNSTKSYVFQLVSKEVCPAKQSGSNSSSGSTNVLAILFIIFLVIFLLYMIIGMLVLKFIRGAEGIEIIPNHEFWLSIPTRMKNGLLFCIAGCKNPPTYDRI